MNPLKQLKHGLALAIRKIKHSAARLVLYFTYSTRGHALTNTYVASRHVCMYACVQLLLTFLRQLRSNTIILSEVYQVEGFLNWIQIERMVSNYFIKNVNEEVWDKDIHAHIHTHAHTRTHTHMHTN